MSGRLKVRSHLCTVRARDSAIGFQLHNDGGVDDKVQLVFTYELRAVPDLDLLLALNGKAAILQFRYQRPAVNAFQKPRAERPMYQPRRIDNSVCRILVVVHTTAIAFVVPCLAYDDVIRYT